MNRLNFEILFHAIPTASLLCDALGNILMANAAAENLLKFDLAELQTLNMIALIPDFKLIDPAEATKVVGHSYQATILKHGKPQHVSVQLSPINTQEKTFVLVSVFDDRRRQAEMALQNSLNALSQQAEHLKAQSKIANLTEREREVMALAVAGYHNKEIARALGISHRTVEIHKSKIMHKTGAANLLDLARIADASSKPKDAQIRPFKPA